MILCDERKVDGMTRKLSISLPDDVAVILDDVDNASAYIAEAIVMRRNRDSLVNLFAAEGIEVTAEGVAHAKEKFTAHRARRAAKSAARRAVKPSRSRIGEAK
jgi:hypothetical protein